jgi:hypothetical protein
MMALRCTIGGDPRDVTFTVVGVLDAARGAQIGLLVCRCERGFTGLRLVWYHGAGDANCELYSFNNAGEKVLLNDRSAAAHIKAYRDRSSAPGPYISSIKPGVNETGVNPKLSLDVVVTEDAAALSPASIQLKINNTQITPTSVTKSGKNTTISYHHPGAVASGTYDVSLAYADTAGNSGVSGWSFSTSPGPCENVAGPAATAYWEFNGNLKATIGVDAKYIDDAISSFYSFGTSGQGSYADIPGINGKPVQFLAIPRNDNGEDFKRTGLRVNPGVAPSGGGKNANVWTMIMDVYWGEGHGSGRYSGRTT